MLAEERRNRILEVLKEKRFVSVNELHDALRVSRETIRRDINRLASESRLIKTHGGAQSMSREEPAFSERMSVNLEAKRAIAGRAADLVPDNATVIIDSGTTCLFTAEALMERRNLTVITNDIHVAGKLADRNDNRVLMLGGELVSGESATMGRDTTTMLANYFADVAFIGISAISDDGVLSDYTREAAAMRATMIEQARTPVLVGDHDKFGWTAGMRVDGMERVRHLVTDRKLQPELAAHLKRTGIEVVIARA